MMSSARKYSARNQSGCKTRLAGLSALALVSMLAAQNAAMAQGVLPPTREEVQRELPGSEDVVTNPAITLDSDLQKASCPLASAEFSEIRFTLSKAEFGGADAEINALLAESWSGLAGQTISVAKVCEIRDRATRILREAGYVASVQVPTQTIEGGVVIFDLVIARLSGLVIRGEPGASAEMLERLFDRLLSSPRFNRNDAERTLLLARDIPGLDVRLSLTRDDGPTAQNGDLIGILDVAFTQFAGDVSALNWSSRAVGRFGGSIRGQVNGLTGLGDMTEVTLYSAAEPKEQIVLQGRHEFGLGSDGLRLGLSGVHAWTQPDVPGADVFEARTFVASLYASYPIVRTQAETIAVSGGFEWIDQDLEFSGLPLSEDQLRTVYLRLSTSSIDRATVAGLQGYSLAEPRFATRASLELRKGLGILGASESCGAGFVNCLGAGAVPIARLDGDPTGLVIRGEARADYRPHPLWTLTAKPRFQFSPDPLLSYEQFSGGNYTAGRGYDPGAVIGDSGLGSQLEVAYGSLYPNDPEAIGWQPFVFFDMFAAYTKNVNGDPVTLTSVGAGLRASIARRAYLEVIGAVPLERLPFQTSRGDARLLVNLVVKLGR
jgi:hemolysin activation/secretion protein